MKPLVLIGGGGHCKSVIEAAESAGYSIEGVFDKPENLGKRILSTKVIGTDEDIPLFVEKVEFVVTLGFILDPTIRIKIFNKIKEAGGKVATVIASTATVSKYATIGEGTVVLHHVVINAGAKVGNNVILNTLSNIEHDAVIGDNTHISTGVMVNGECIIGERCFIGSQSVLSNCITVGDDIIVGASSFVRKSIYEKGIYTGNPAILRVKAK